MSAYMLELNLLFILFLLLCSAISSATETAFTALSVGKIQNAKSDGNNKASIILELVRIKNKVISSLLIANNIFNILATSLVTALLISIFGDQGAIISTIIMSVLIILFAEVLPKNLAVLYPERISLVMATPLKILVKLLTPINFILNFAVRLAIKFTGKPNENTQASIDEEVRGIIEYQHDEGNVVKRDRDMLGGLLDLKNITVSDIMIHRNQVFALDYDLPLQQIVKLALEKSYTRVPLWQKERDNIVGFLHLREVLKSLHDNNYDFGKLNGRDFVSEPWFIADNTPVSKQLHEFRRRKSHVAMVVDEYGDVQGIVTLEDILEEIVGNIEDETDEVNKLIEKRNNSYIIDGSAPIRDINRQLDWELPDENASTIAGLVINEIKRIPEQGETFNLYGFKIYILKKHLNRIKSVKVKNLPKKKAKK